MLETIVRKEKLAYSIAEAADLTGVSKDFVRKEIRSKKLKAKLVGRRVLILNKDLEDYLQEKTDWIPTAERNNQ